MKTKTRTITSVKYRDLERFAKQVYDLVDYSFISVEECGNDSSHEFGVDGKLDTYDELEAAHIIKSKDVPCYQNGLLLNMLCRDGHIEPGTYLVEVCW